MTDLLDLAVRAHGGLERWNNFRELCVRVSLTGPMYAIKGHPQGMANVIMRIATREPAVDISSYPAAGSVGHFRPDRTWMTDRKGMAIDERPQPRSSFAGHVLESRWDPSQLLYFNAYAMWNYLSAPFLFMRPGFKTEEVNPHHENGDVWRRLRVTFPPDIPTHCPQQVFYFDTGGLLQRIDYETEVAGGVAAHYCYDHAWFGGILFPTLRRVVRRTEEGTRSSLPAAILIRVSDILVS